MKTPSQEQETPGGTWEMPELATPSQEPVITDHEGRPMTYWGGKAAPSQEPVTDGCGPSVRASKSCHGCSACVSESYAIQGDSGHKVYCTHPSVGNKRIGDTTWKTPDWCPVMPPDAAAQIAEWKRQGLYAEDFITKQQKQIDQLQAAARMALEWFVWFGQSDAPDNPPYPRREVTTALREALGERHE